MKLYPYFRENSKINGKQMTCLNVKSKTFKLRRKYRIISLGLGFGREEFFKPYSKS